MSGDFPTGWLALAAGAVPLLWRLYRSYRWIPARGKIISMGQRSDGEGTSWAPRISFTAGGQTQSFEGNYAQLFGSAPKYKIGEPVDILYHPTDPSRAMIDHWTPFLLLAGFAVLFVAAFLAAGSNATR